MRGREEGETHLHHAMHTEPAAAGEPGAPSERKKGPRGEEGARPLCDAECRLSFGVGEGGGSNGGEDGGGSNTGGGGEGEGARRGKTPTLDPRWPRKQGEDRDYMGERKEGISAACGRGERERREEREGRGAGREDTF